MTAFVTAGGAAALSRRHRAWIALYSLDAGRQDRAEILRQNSVTEADLAEFFESWYQMRSRTTSMAA